MVLHSLAYPLLNRWIGATFQVVTDSLKYERLTDIVSDLCLHGPGMLTFKIPLGCIDRTLHDLIDGDIRETGSSGLRETFD